MFDAPRCREWTPLATQQLRLRSLIQIVGYNIRPPERQPPLAASACCYYYTLHATCMSAPFYTSERISSPHPKWRELRADVTQRNSSTNVVIRIWCHLQTHDNTHTSDIIIQTWGVYFSGLRLIGANLALDFTSDSFKTNTLVFQMHGGYFCSYKSLNLQVIPSENLYELNSVSSGSSGSQRIPIEANYLQNHRIIKESRSISPSKRSYRSELEYSKSQSPPERGFKQSFAKIKPSASLNIAQSRKAEAEYIYEHSPDNLDVKVFTISDFNCDSDSNNASKEELYRSNVDLSESAEMLDIRQEDGIPKCRYLHLNFLKSEIRPSYNSSKLQNLHLLQYSIKKRKDSVKDIKERIYNKSAIANLDDSPSIDDQVINPKLRRSQRNLFCPEEETDRRFGDKARSPNGKVAKNEDFPPSNGPRLTLKLNDLLSYKTRPSPHQRSEHARLTRQLEVLRFKKMILSDERDSKTANIRRLKEKHAKLFEENQDLGSELMQGYHTLSRRTEQLRSTRQSTAALRELVARAQTALAARRTKLLADLQDIFYIENPAETWTICGVALPIFGDEEWRRGSAATADAVAAGYAAQCCSLAAALLSQPLRYPLKLLGSTTHITDNLQPLLPSPQIPLYGDPTLFRYGMFLLNKCCAQLLWGCGLVAPDARPTLANLRRLSTCAVPAKDCLMEPWRAASSHGALECPHSQSLRSLVASERGKRRQFNRFKDAVDGHSPGEVCGLWRHRQSRSVGSYHDDPEMRNIALSTTSVMGSEPFLHDPNEETKRSYLKTSNSDSQLSVRTTPTPDKVIFTLGDEHETMEEIKPALVKISSNNGDACEKCLDDVKKICSEIDDWTEQKGTTDVCENADENEHWNQNDTKPDERVWSRFGVTVNEIEDGGVKTHEKEISNVISESGRDLYDTENCMDKVACDECIAPQCSKMVEEVIKIQNEEAKIDNCDVSDSKSDGKSDLEV